MLTFFDKLEDSVREHLSTYPIIYSIVGGILLVLFWRGVWGTADILEAYTTGYRPEFNSTLGFIFYPPMQLLLSTLGLLLTGLMVSVFIGDRIILSGLRHEKKMEEKTKELVTEEVITLAHIQKQLKELQQEIQNLKK